MKFILQANEFINGIVWGIPAMILMLGTGILISAGCAFPQFTRFGQTMRYILRQISKKPRCEGGSVTPFKAMCTALAASGGTGNIAGVSGAIALGGPGAVFWMWVSALLGMGTKFAEVTLAVHYRERNQDGDWVGGPMYYIRSGLGKQWTHLASAFSLFGCLAAFGIGNMTQINTVAGTVNEALGGFIALSEAQKAKNALIVGIICSLLVFFVLVGGIRRIGDVCALLVPLMAILYMAASIIVIAVNIHNLPAAFRAICVGAFDPGALGGGLAGISIKTAVTRGVGRGIFSNEAGLGSAPIAHAAADVKHPAEQGMYGIFEVFMDTIVVCSMTAMVILLGVGTENIEFGTDTGAALTVSGFRSVFSGAIPGVIVAVCLILFALSSVLSWGLYGSRCCEFLLGSIASRIYPIIFSLFTVVGAVMELSTAWAIADTLNGLMALPNLIALLGLSPTVFRLSKEYFGSCR